MKRNYLYAGLVAASLGLTACNEDFKDWADPQSNAQEDASAVVQNGVISAITTDIKKEELTNTDIQLVKFVSAQGGDANSTVKFTKLILDDKYEVPFTSEDSVLTVNVDDIDADVISEYQSLAYTTRTLNFKVEAAIVNEGGVAVDIPIESNTVSVNYLPGQLPANAKESAYYYIGGACNWSFDSAIPFTNNGDGTYTLTLEIGADEWFCFAPKSAVDAKDWDSLFRAPSNGCEDTSGLLNNSSTSGYSFKCATAGKYVFTLDMNNYTWSYYPFVEAMYYSGDANGWANPNDGNTNYRLTETSTKGCFRGYYYALDADNSSTWGIKFVSGTTWYGDGGNGTISSSGGNIDPGKDAFYQMDVNMNNSSYTLTEVKSITMVGNHNNWNQADATMHMTYDKTDNCWSITHTFATAAEVKFAMNDDWKVSWGGNGSSDNYSNLTQNDGKNLAVAAGTYTIKLYLSYEGNNKVVFENASSARRK